MTLNTIDRAFVDRWRARRPSVDQIDQLPPALACDPRPSSPAAIEPCLPPAPVPTGPPADAAAPTAGSLVDRLLVAGRSQWDSLADEVEAARSAGHRVIAVAGGEQGEGRTTLIDCLARTLRDRGRDVAILRADEDEDGVVNDTVDDGRLHDRRIVLVDAGIWFPPGPIRRERVGRASVGCDAAILVRRADREAIHARSTALAAVGVSVLGEVVTFAPALGDF